MAQSVIPITVLSANAGVQDAGGLSLATLAGNAAGGSIATSQTRNLIIRVSNTDVAAHVITFLAGVYPPSIRSAGNLAISVAAGKTEYIALESSRFVDANGNISVTADAGSAGDIEAYQLGSGV